MRTSLLTFVCACAPAVPARPAPAPPPTAAPLPAPVFTPSPIGPPLTAATRLLDRPAAALAIAWTHPLGKHQQPVIVDRRLVLLERWLSDDPEQRYAVLDAATGAVASRGALPMARALCPAEWHGQEPLSAPTRQCDPFELVSFDLARRATRWQASLADDTIVFGDILGSIRGHTNLVRVDAGTQSIEHARIDEATGMVHNLPALPGLWNNLYPGHTAIVGDTIFLAVTTGEPLARFARGVAAGGPTSKPRSTRSRPTPPTSSSSAKIAPSSCSTPEPAPSRVDASPPRNACTRPSSPATCCSATPATSFRTPR